MTTVQETLDQLQEKQHELAIFAILVEHLDGKYLPHAARLAQGTILAEGCSQIQVPEPAIEAVRDLLMENHIGPLEAEIAALKAKKVK